MNDTETAWHGEGPGEVGLVEWRDFDSRTPFLCKDGRSIPELTLRYETYGHLNADRSNAILICHALSGDHHCAGVHSVEDRKPGWWNHFIGPGKAIDTRDFFVICSNCLGGCQGSTGPSSVNPETGRRYGLDFPQVTIEDMVVAQERLVTHLGIEKLFCVVGGSMGGMQVLEWAVSYPHRVRTILPMATTARQGAQAIAFNEVGRQAIVLDPGWREGNYEPGAGPDVGLAVARMMAHITYLSDEGLDKKFGRMRRSGVTPAERHLFGAEFEVESYLRYQGRSFVNRFDANTYLYISKALDLYDLHGRHESGLLEKVFEPVQAATLAIGFRSDWLFPPSANREIVLGLLKAGKAATYTEMAMEFGHDSFLLHAPSLYARVKRFLEFHYRS